MVTSEAAPLPANDQKPWYQQTWMLAIRWVLAALLLIASAASLCLGLVGNWTRDYVANTDTFVSTLAPLAQDVRVQRIVSERAGSAVKQAVLDAPVTSTVDQLINPNGSGSGVLGALSGLVTGSVEQAVGAVADQAETMTQDSTIQLMQSPAFSPVFNQVIEDLHSQLISALESPEQVSPDPVLLTLQVDPIVDAATKNLTGTAGLVAGLIPQTGQRIPLFQIKNLDQWKPWYGLIVEDSQKFFLISGAFALLALLIAPRRFIALALLGVAAACLAGYVVLKQPEIGQKMFVALDPSLSGIASDMWHRFTDPLAQSLKPVVYAGAAVALTGTVLAVMTRTGRGSHQRDMAVIPQ